MVKLHLQYSHDTIGRLDDLDAMFSVSRPSSSRKPFDPYTDDVTDSFLHISQLTILMETTFAQSGGSSKTIEQTQTPSKEKADTESTATSSQC